MNLKRKLWKINTAQMNSYAHTGLPGPGVGRFGPCGIGRRQGAPGTRGFDSNVSARCFAGIPGWSCKLSPIACSANLPG